MKKLLTLSFFFISTAVFAQANKTAPVISPAFTDSVEAQIRRISSANYSINLVYSSPIAVDGKLTDPRIMKQNEFTSDTETDHTNNNFVVAMRKLLMAAPA